MPLLLTPTCPRCGSPADLVAVNPDTSRTYRCPTCEADPDHPANAPARVPAEPLLPQLAAEIERAKAGERPSG